MEDINKLESKINKLEYDRIAKLEEKVGSLQVNLERNTVLAENSIETQKTMTQAVSKMAETMDTVKLTMCQLSGQIEQSNKISETLANNVDSLSNRMGSLEVKVDSKIEEVTEKVDKIDDKGKIDTAVVIKDMIARLIFGGGCIGAVFYLIYYFTK